MINFPKIRETIKDLLYEYSDAEMRICAKMDLRWDLEDRVFWPMIETSIVPYARINNALRREFE